MPAPHTLRLPRQLFPGLEDAQAVRWPSRNATPHLPLEPLTRARQTKRIDEPRDRLLPPPPTHPELTRCGHHRYAAPPRLRLPSSPLPSCAAAEEAQPEDLVNALNGVFGAHAGKRAAHTKGICLKGNFTPTAEAPSLTKAPHFAGPVPVDSALLARRRQPCGIRRAEGQRARPRHPLRSRQRQHDRPARDLGAHVRRQDAGAVRGAAQDGGAGSRRQAGRRQDHGLLQGEPEQHAPGRVAQRAPDTGKLRNRRLLRRARLHAHQRQGRQARHQVEVRAGEERAGLDR